MSSVQKTEYPHKELAITGSRHVTVEGGRHVIYSEEGREAMNFWEAAGAGQKLFAYMEDAPAEEEEDEQERNYREEGHELNYGDKAQGRPKYLDEEWVKEKLFPYIGKPEGEILRATMDTLNDFYQMDFSLKWLAQNLDKYPEICPSFTPWNTARLQTARDIFKIASVAIYEDMCSEHGRFAGFEKADLFLQAASKFVPDEDDDSDGRTWMRSYESMQKNTVEEARKLFIEVHPAASKFCDVCVTDRKVLMDAARKEQSKRAAEFAASLPEDLKGIVAELKDVSSKVGAFIQYRDANKVKLTVKNIYGHKRTYGKEDFPKASEMPGLEKREQQLRANALAKMHTYGIKGTVWPLVETQCIDVAAMDREKQEMLDRAKEKAEDRQINPSMTVCSG